MMQDSRVETYLQSQEEDGGSMLADIKSWAHSTKSSLQNLMQQTLSARQSHRALDESDWVSTVPLHFTCHA